MANLPLVQIKDNLATTDDNTVYTVPASSGGGNVTEAILLNLLLVNTHPVGEDISVDVYINDGSQDYYIERNKIVKGETFVDDIDLWNLGIRQLSSPDNITTKRTALDVGYTVNVTADSAIESVVPVLSVIGTVHLVNDL